MKEIVDLTIVGAGPVGLFGAFYSGMRSMSCKIIDSLPQLGGQLAALYPKKYIYDIPGYTKVIAENLIAELEKQAMQFNPIICLSEKVIKLEYDPEDNSLLKLTTDKNRSHYSRAVIIAVGAGAFVPRKLDIHNVDELEGKGLCYVVKDPEHFRDKDVVIIGGGDSALDWALTLETMCKKVTLIHRAKKFNAHEDSVNKLHQSKVEVLVPYETVELYGTDKLEGILVLNKDNNESRKMHPDAVICNIGFLTNLGPIKDWGLELEDNAIAVDQTMGTNLKGVWAAGDIITYSGKLKLISTGFADAAIAVNMAKNYLDPTAKVYPGKSSSKQDMFKV